MVRIFVVAAILITLPALVAAVYALATGRWLILIAAVLSVAMNSVPFIAAAFLLRKNADAADLGH